MEFLLEWNQNVIIAVIGLIGAAIGSAVTWATAKAKLRSSDQLTGSA